MMNCLPKPHTLWVRIITVTVAALVSVSATASIDSEKALGHVQAPVTLIEYGSLACDYCIRFHREVLPLIQSRHIDSGRVRFIFRDFPTSEASARGAVAARCANDKYYDMLKTLFSNVAQWSLSDDIDASLARLAKPLGIEAKQFDACLKDPNNNRAIVKAQQDSRVKFNIVGTPTFLINGKIVRGRKSIEEMEILIKDALSEVNSASKAVKE